MPRTRFDRVVTVIGFAFIFVIVIIGLTKALHGLWPDQWGPDHWSAWADTAAALISGMAFILLYRNLKVVSSQLDLQRINSEPIFALSTAQVRLELALHPPPDEERTVMVYRVELRNSGGAAYRVRPTMSNAITIHPCHLGPPAIYSMSYVAPGATQSLTWFGMQPTPDAIGGQPPVPLVDVGKGGTIRIVYTNFQGKPQVQEFSLTSRYNGPQFNDATFDFAQLEAGSP